MNRPYVGLAVMLLNPEKEVLLGLRSNSHGAGTWCFPGGHLEFFESLETCAYRELEEETGFEKEDVVLIGSNPFAVTNDFFPEEKKHYITVYMHAHYAGNKKPEVKEKLKCLEWKWFAFEKFPSNLFLPVQNLIKQYHYLFQE